MMKVTVRPASSSEEIPALELLFAEADDPSEQVEETLALARQGEISFAGLLLAERNGRLVGAGLFAEQPGRVGFVWPPGVRRGEEHRSTIEDAILTDIALRLDALRLCFGQVVLDPHWTQARGALERNGFPHLTDLHYMLCPANSTFFREPSTRFETETFDASANSERFARLLERTYLETLDCPELNGLRSAEEALAAHQATGRFDPGRWWLFRHEGNDAGLLLLNEHPDREIWEIVYLGVSPEARGHGLGEHMVRKALAEAGRDWRSVVLAVDARNHLARRIYRRTGFLDLTVQSVHLRQAGADGPISQSTNYAQPSGTRKRIS